MPLSELRSALRDHTSASHARLDSAVGLFSDREDYSSYLRDTYRFRCGLEERLAGFETWTVSTLATSVRVDMEDLGSVPGDPVGFGGLGPTPSHLLGAAYVAEGSALGARLLVSRAAQLGFDRTSGARHLDEQTGDRTRWPAFLVLLDTVDRQDYADVLEGAEQTFAFALAVYAGEFA